MPDVSAEPAIAIGTNKQPAGEADNADDSAVAGDEFTNVAASKRTNNHGQRSVRGK